MKRLSVHSGLVMTLVEWILLKLSDGTFISPRNVQSVMENKKTFLEERRWKSVVIVSKM